MNAATITAIQPGPTEVPALAPVAAPKRKKQPARTKLDRAQRAIELEKLERSRKEEADKAPRFSARHRFVLFILLGLAAFMAVASFTTSFNGLFGATAWAVGNGSPVLQVAAPLMYDVAILAFSIKLFIDREDGDNALWTWVWIAALALVSSATNIVHTLAVSAAKTPTELAIGCVISGSAPLLLALIVDVAASKVFKKPEVNA